ncbi:MAG: type IV toxin-antitoxin system AbiEi family antitoxin [Clostridium sp.]
MSQQEIKTVNKALNNLQNVAGIHGEWEFLEHTKNTGIDGILTISLGENRISFKTDIKKEIRHTHIELIKTRANVNDMFLLLAQNIFPKAKEMLRNENIAYLDIAGNFYFRNESCYIFIEGNRIPTVEKEKPNRAFTPTGLKIVFLLLTEKNALNMSYREIAHRANVALGNVPLVINNLQEAGYLIAKNRNKYIITRKRELLDRWITGYGETLKPKLMVGRYRFLKNNKYWKEQQLAPGDVWGGEAGANIMSNYIEPEIKTLYTKLSKMELMTKMMLVPDSKGDIEIIQHFWQEAYNLEKYCAPPILIYADLIISQDPRNIEVAESIFDSYLKADFS